MRKIFKMKTGVYCFGFLIFAVLGCQKGDLSGEEIIKQSIQAHGGMDAWNNIKQLSFDKETTLFLEDGSVEVKTKQFQLFRFDRKLFGKMEWEMGDDEIQIVYENDKISKVINDSLISDKTELQKAENSFWAAHHVVCKPFDLTGENISLTRRADYELEGKSYYAVQIEYEGDDETSDKWTYIIDKSSFLMVANKVALTDHTSLIENLSYDSATDFIFNAHRKSYRLNKAGEKTYLRAEYFYTNYDVQQ